MDEAPCGRIFVSRKGPFRVEGNVRLIVGGRTELEEKGAELYFCRCGQSGNRPFCDGSHRKEGFSDEGRIQGGKLVGGSDESEWLTVRCRPAGPLVLSGRVALASSDGEVVEGAKGALCRCGLSRSKPFCDGSHRELMEGGDGRKRRVPRSEGEA